VADAITVRILLPGKLDKLMKKLLATVGQPEKLLSGIGWYYKRFVRDMFKSSGALSGNRWKPLARDTVYTRAGTRRIKYGTRRAPKRSRGGLAAYKRGLGAAARRRGPLKGYEAHKRYGSPLDPPMLVSGDFRESFGVRRITGHKMIFGSSFPEKKAAAIMAGRPVLVVTGTVRRKLDKLMLGWLRKGLV
jgi:hypothetical protein